MLWVLECLQKAVYTQWTGGLPWLAADGQRYLVQQHAVNSTTRLVSVKCFVNTQASPVGHDTLLPGGTAHYTVTGLQSTSYSTHHQNHHYTLF